MNYFGFAAIGTVLATGWSYIQGAINRLRSYIIVSVELEGYLNYSMQLLLWEKFNRRHVGDRAYLGRLFHVRPISKFIIVGFEIIGKGLTIFWRGWTPIFVNNNGAQSSNNNSPTTGGSDPGLETIFIRGNYSFFRGTFKFDELLIEAIDLYNDRNIAKLEVKEYKRFFVRKVVGTRQSLRNGNVTQPGIDIPKARTSSSGRDVLLESGSRILKWNKDDIGEDIADKPFETLEFPPEVDKYIEEIKRWKNSADWFRKKSIPYRLGILLFGIPGTGKTAMTRALGQVLDMPIYIYDLATMTNEDLNREWESMMGNAPVIALFEDLDGVFHGRNNVQGKDGITFDCLLNCISGVSNSDGVLTIVTTNDITKIDPAMGNFAENGMSSRPGRLDKIIELKKMTKQSRLNMAKRILEDCSHEVDNLVEKGDGYTPAQFQELCTQVALKYYWESK
jgi:hypothetical protein